MTATLTDQSSTTPRKRRWRRRLAAPVAIAATLGLAGTALAAEPVEYDQDFSVDASGWFDEDDSWVGTVTHNAADETATFEGSTSGPFSRFGGYSDTWPAGGYTAEIDVYLDPAWSVGEGFDYGVASSRSDGSHLRDFIFHVGVVDESGVQGLLVNGSNNADFTTNPFKLLNDNGGDYYVVETAGWYTLQHAFRDEAGALAVDLNLLDSDNNVVWTATRTNAADTIADVVGGNRYAWFTHIEVADGIEVDDHELYLGGPRDPAPSSKDDCKKGGFAAFGFDNQGQCVASLTANANAGK